MIEGYDPYMASYSIVLKVHEYNNDLIELDTGLYGEGSKVIFTTVAARKLIAELERLIKEIEQGE